MATKTRAELTALWITGYTPTQQDYTNLFDSFENKKTDVIPLEYLAKITQVGTDAPTVVVLKNTLGQTPEYSYDSPGWYYATGTFAAAKTVVRLDGVFSGTDSGTTYSQYAILETADNIAIHTIRNGSGTDGLLNGTTSIQILIYP